jgi:hypothetical protein
MVADMDHRCGGKFEFRVSAAKWLHNIRFLADQGMGAVASALFIDGKFTSGQTADGKKKQDFSSLGRTSGRRHREQRQDFRRIRIQK